MELEDVEPWPRPEDSNWGPFEEAVLYIFDTWDVRNRAVDEEWGGDESEFLANKLVDDVLANYAERWIARRDTRAEAVAEYLIEEFDEKFRCDLDMGVAHPLALAINTLYNECRIGDFRGSNFMLAKKRAADAAMHAESSRMLAVVEAAPAELEDSTAAASIPDADGWVVVDAKKKKGKR